MIALLLHVLGDYVLQSDWMAQEKTKRWWPTLAHATTYTLPFLILTQCPTALFVIWSTHAVIDHYRLARYICWAKNFLAPRRYWYKWDDCSGTGYLKTNPPFMSVWLMIIVDNWLHITINWVAITWL